MMMPEARSFVSRHRKGLQFSQFKNQDFPIKEHWKPKGISKLTVGTVYNSAYFFFISKQSLWVLPSVVIEQLCRRRSV